MKNALVLIKVLILSAAILTQTSCFEDSLNKTPVEIDTAYNHTISAFGTNYYTVTIPATGNYTVSLTNCDTDLSWELYDGTTDALLWDQDDSSSNDDEIYGTTVPAGTYTLVVEEWDDIPSSYTLQVYTGLPSK